MESSKSGGNDESGKDFVSVDISGNDSIHCRCVGNDADERNGKKQGTLMNTLWNEATCTKELPQPHAHQHQHHQLHQRHGINGSNGSKVTFMSTPIKKRHARHFGSKGENIAKHVWRAAIAAFVCSVFIAMAMAPLRFLFRRRGKGGTFGPWEHLLDYPQLAPEDQVAAMSLFDAHSHRLQSIKNHDIDTSQYTIRMKPTLRNEQQLLLSVNHYATCEGVKEIQVIWCDDKNEPPDEIARHKSGKVKIERHAINSVNERFKVLMDPPTLGILSLDDDVLRPCVALDAAFLRWTRHPERMVGFDVRTHVEEKDKKGTHWKYGPLSITERSNEYSFTLSRAAFLHRDYLDIYTLALPRPMYAYIAENVECEDVAMSFLVSSLTRGKPPLLADLWAVESIVKSYSEQMMSGGDDSIERKDKCVNDFAEMLGLKGKGIVDGVRVRPLQRGTIVDSNDRFFKYGAEPEDWTSIDPSSFSNPRLKEVVKTMHWLKSISKEDRDKWLEEQKESARSG